MPKKARTHDDNVKDVEGKEATKQIVIHIPDEIHRAAKIKAIIENKSLHEAIVSLITNWAHEYIQQIQGNTKETDGSK